MIECWILDTDAMYVVLSWIICIRRASIWHPASQIVQPPSMTWIWPVVKADSSDAR